MTYFFSCVCVARLVCTCTIHEAGSKNKESIEIRYFSSILVLDGEWKWSDRGTCCQNGGMSPLSLNFSPNSLWVEGAGAPFSQGMERRLFNTHFLVTFESECSPPKFSLGPFVPACIAAGHIFKKRWKEKFCVRLIQPANPSIISFPIAWAIMPPPQSLRASATAKAAGSDLVSHSKLHGVTSCDKPLKICQKPLLFSSTQKDQQRFDHNLKRKLPPPFELRWKSDLSRCTMQALFILHAVWNRTGRTGRMGWVAMVKLGRVPRKTPKRKTRDMQWCPL